MEQENKRLYKAKLNSNQVHLPPNTTDFDNKKRNKWLEESINGFITNSKANREIYRWFLEIFWPEDHGIPGPILSTKEIREIISNRKGKAYQDVFRRLRELQGEEGFHGIIKCGNNYQLQKIEIQPKKKPRGHLSKDKWEELLSEYNHTCPICGASNTEIDFQQDHKVPRSRGGNDDDSNWQPLCKNCNNIKSIICRGCSDKCETCAWAHPLQYTPIRHTPEFTKRMNEYTKNTNITSSSLIENLVTKHINDWFNSSNDID